VLEQSEVGDVGQPQLVGGGDGFLDDVQVETAVIGLLQGLLERPEEFLVGVLGEGASTLGNPDVVGIGIEGERTAP
jgi:hypothetical protein